MRNMTVRNKCFTYVNALHYAMVDPARPRELFMELNDQIAGHYLFIDGATFSFFIYLFFFGTAEHAQSSYKLFQQTVNYMIPDKVRRV